ncbi:hypothetical protein V8G54_002399 [Vigna mungo]|uniref:Protein NO VEIN C-terminal domain-containing protein n=1 Tax=Vigna mungo TaxID=3915 RepID=A0AAQ3PAL6_VIGMU
MITTMAESGSSEEQIEFFILNSQKVPKLPVEEPIFQRRKIVVCPNWPLADWKTAPDFSYARANGFKTKPAQVGSFSEMKKDDVSGSIISPPFCAEQESLIVDWTIKEDPSASSVALVLHNNVNNFYTTKESDYHSLFLELFSLLLDRTSELHMANFLHMITTMAESGSSEEQIEFFILNSQKVPKLPVEEPVWTLSFISSLTEFDTLKPSDLVLSANEQIFERRKIVVCPNWPLANWKTAPDFSYARANGFKTKPAQVGSFSEMKKDDVSGSIISPPFCAEQESLIVDWTIKEDPSASSVALVLHNNFASFSNKEQLQTGTFDANEGKVTGRLGEFLACKYFVDKVGKTSVRWFNEINETGLPYELVISEDNNEEFIEVKATRSPKKDWFNISLREWQFANDRSESYSIAFVALMANNVARITIFKDPVKLCQCNWLL